MEVYQCPPNGSGMHVLQLLGILGGFETPEQGPISAERYHRHIEAARLVYRDRDAFLADPSQVDVPVAKLTDPAYLAALRGLIRDDRAMPEMPPAGESDWARHKDTVYLCVVEPTAMPVPSSTACSSPSGPASWRRIGRHAAQPGLRLPAAGRPCELHRAEQAAACTPSSPAW